MARALLVPHPLMLLRPGSTALALLAASGWSNRPVRHEREVVAALGEPLLAAHPASEAGLCALCRQLARYWFAGGRRLLPIVALASQAPRALQLARAFAVLGARTLLVDADLRSPRLHAYLGVPRGNGLADALDGRAMRVAVVESENLAVLPAGRVRAEPLELLSRDCLGPVLRAAAEPFDVALIATAPLERGPDFEIFAALAGGALVLVPEGAGASELRALRARLARCAARVVATILERG